MSHKIIIVFQQTLKFKMMLSSVVRKACLQRTFATSSAALKSTGSAQTQMDDFWNKNKNRNRPMSPHLTIYKPQLTSMLSISTRITGMVLTGATCLFAGATAVYSGDMECLLTYVAGMKETMTGQAALYVAKMTIAFPFAFHTCNGLRHLVWDMAKGLSLREVYLGGWAVVAMSLLLSNLFVLLYP